MPWRTIFVGGLGLIALQTAVTNPDAAGRLRDGLLKIADLIRSAADPTIPAIPDLRTGGGGDDGGDDGGMFGDDYIPDWLEDPPFPTSPLDPVLPDWDI